jgi:hypothetical protein
MDGLLGQTDLGSTFMEGSEVAEVNKSGWELRCNDTLHDLGLSTWFTGTTRSRSASTTGVLVGVGC